MITKINCLKCAANFKINDKEYFEHHFIEETAFVRKYKFVCPRCKHEIVLKKELIR